MKSYRKLPVILSLILLVAASCSSPQKKLSGEITSQEKVLYTDSLVVPDPAVAGKMIDLYLAYAEQFPTDTLTPVYLFKAGDLASKMNEVHMAVEIFTKLVSGYPDHRNAPFALFLQGFIYENQSGDPAKAKSYYEQFLQRYPDHPIAADVTFSLENLGKSPEELIREFEQNNQLPADSANSPATVSN